MTEEQIAAAAERLLRELADEVARHAQLPKLRQMQLSSGGPVERYLLPAHFTTDIRTRTRWQRDVVVSAIVEILDRDGRLVTRVTGHHFGDYTMHAEHDAVRQLLIDAPRFALEASGGTMIVATSRAPCGTEVGETNCQYVLARFAQDHGLDLRVAQAEPPALPDPILGTRRRWERIDRLRLPGGRGWAPRAITVAGLPSGYTAPLTAARRLLGQTRVGEEPRRNPITNLASVWTLVARYYAMALRGELASMSMVDLDRAIYFFRHVLLSADRLAMPAPPIGTLSEPRQAFFEVYRRLLRESFLRAAEPAGTAPGPATRTLSGSVPAVATGPSPLERHLAEMERTMLWTTAVAGAIGVAAGLLMGAGGLAQLAAAWRAASGAAASPTAAAGTGVRVASDAAVSATSQAAAAAGAAEAVEAASTAAGSTTTVRALAGIAGTAVEMPARRRTASTMPSRSAERAHPAPRAAMPAPRPPRPMAGPAIPLAAMHDRGRLGPAWPDHVEPLHPFQPSDAGTTRPKASAPDEDHEAIARPAANDPQVADEPLAVHPAAADRSLLRLLPTHRVAAPARLPRLAGSDGEPEKPPAPLDAPPPRHVFDPGRTEVPAAASEVPGPHHPFELEVVSAADRGTVAAHGDDYQSADRLAGSASHAAPDPDGADDGHAADGATPPAPIEPTHAGGAEPSPIDDAEDDGASVAAASPHVAAVGASAGGAARQASPPFAVPPERHDDAPAPVVAPFEPAEDRPHADAAEHDGPGTEPAAAPASPREASAPEADEPASPGAAADGAGPTHGAPAHGGDSSRAPVAKDGAGTGTAADDDAPIDHDDPPDDPIKETVDDEELFRHHEG